MIRRSEQTIKYNGKEVDLNKLAKKAIEIIIQTKEDKESLPETTITLRFQGDMDEKLNDCIKTAAKNRPGDFIMLQHGQMGIIVEEEKAKGWYRVNIIEKGIINTHDEFITRNYTQEGRDG